MKRILALLCAALLLLALAACGEKTPAADDPASYNDYMTEEQYNKMKAIAATYRANYDELTTLMAQVTMEEGTDKTIDNLRVGIETLEAILANPSKLADKTPDEQILLAETQNLITESLLLQFHAQLGA